ncbi:unnamed protein product [Cochlearia groenlandica]
MLEGIVSTENLSLSSMDMYVLERLDWLQQQQVMSQSSNNSHVLPQLLEFQGSNNDDEFLQSVFSQFQILGPNFNIGFGHDQHEAIMDGCISRTSSCHIETEDTMKVLLKKNIGIALKNKRKSEARREKISKKMKYLQDIVPGCNKVIGKAGMLDEIINYVQSLQRQVEFLSMKLAVLKPEFELSLEDLSEKQSQSLYNTSTIGFDQH